MSGANSTVVDINTFVNRSKFANKKCICESSQKKITEFEVFTSDNPGKYSYCKKYTKDNDVQLEQSDHSTPFNIFPHVNKGLRIACHNIHRLSNKLDELKILLDTDKPPPDLYCLCETFVTPTTGDNYHKINGYSLVRRDRIHKGGGGVRIYIRNGINFHRRHDLEDKFIKIICIEIKYSNKSILLSTVYRPPDNDGDPIQNWINLMETSLYKMYSQNKPTILMCDIDIDFLSDKVDKLKKSWIDLTTNYKYPYWSYLCNERSPSFT